MPVTMLSMQVQAGLVFAMALALTPAVLECRLMPNEQGGFPPWRVALQT
jgi:hypothetical protein